MTSAAVGWHAWLTAAVVLLVLVALALEFAGPATVLLGGLVLLMLCGVIEPEPALSGFANPAMLAVGALFVVAAAVQRTGALGFLGQLMRPRSDRIEPALARVMLPASLLSAFLNNTPIVAFLTPMVQSWARQARIPASKLLMPLSFATILGGMCTVIGTSTNLIVSNLLEQQTGRGFAMFELAWVGLPAALVGLLYFVLVGHRTLPAGEDQAAVGALERRSYQFDLRVPADSPLVGQTIERAGLRHLQDAFLAHLLRHGELLGPVSPNLTLEAGDVLTFYGSPGRMDSLLQSGRLARVIEPVDDEGRPAHLPFYEAVVASESTLCGRSLKASGFRERFQAVVLGIHRKGRRLEGPIGQSAIEAGDLLLIEAGPNFEELWSQSGEFYLVAPLERPTRAPASDRARWVLLILAALIASVTLGVLPIVTASFVAAILVVLCGSLSVAEARRSVNLSVLVVIASAFGLGKAIQQTGLADLFAGQMLQISAGLGALVALALIYVCTNVLTEILTNSVSAVLVFPVGMALAANLGLDPRPVAVTIAIAASASFATPIGYQTNLMVMGPGGYRFRNYFKTGLPLNLAILILTLWLVPRIW